jgi:Holliday junction resolvase RusA-like endonuclease
MSTKKIQAQIQLGKKMYKTTKPDLDNLEKMLYDTMQNRVYINDSQICSRFSEKIYGNVPGVNISLKHIVDE